MQGFKGKEKKKIIKNTPGLEKEISMKKKKKNLKKKILFY